MFGPKRRPNRKRTQQDAWIAIAGSFATRHCVILDLSEGGARLLLDDPSFTAPKFELKYSRTGKGRPCRIAWRRGREVGATFL